MATLAAAAPVRRETEWSLTVAAAVLVIFLAAAPFVLYPVFIMKALCFALFACAFNLLIGYVGLVSFGHALYFGWAGYLAGYAAKVWGLPPELAVLTGTATGMVLGMIAGVVAIRRQGIYFAMITLAPHIPNDPSPHVGEGREGGSKNTPLPAHYVRRPPPQGGRQQTSASARYS